MTQQLSILIVVIMFTFISFKGFMFFYHATAIENRDKYIGLTIFGISALIGIKYMFILIYPTLIEMLKT